MAEQQIKSDQIALRSSALTSSSAHIAWDMSLGDNFTHTFTENTTLDAPTNATIGKSGYIYLTQHASSPKTLAYASGIEGPNGVKPTVTATAGAKDVIQYIVCPDGAVLLTSALNRS